MSAPENRIEPKDREELWSETRWGWLWVLFGFALIGQYSYHSGHGHEMERAVLWIGVACLSYGSFRTNRKLTIEWMDKQRDLINQIFGGKAK